MADTTPSSSSSPAPAVRPLWRPGENPTVDLVMFRQRAPEAPIEILVIRRGDDAPACPDMRAVPGGFVDSLTPRGAPFVAAETARQAALRELAEETGLSLAQLESMIQEIGRYDSLERDPRSSPQAYIASTAFSVMLTGDLGRWGDDLTPGTDAKEARWTPVAELLDEIFAFDHGRIIEDAARVMGVALPGPLRSWADERVAAPRPPKP